TFAFSAIAVIAVVDYFVKPNIGLGWLYFFPLLVGAGFLSRGQIVITALACAGLREAFSPFHHNIESIPRSAMVWLAFSGVGLFMRELVLNRHQAVEHMAQLKSEIDLREQEVRRREDAERQLEALVESSTAAIVTTDGNGAIELSNEAARKLLRTTEPLAGQNIGRFIPDVAVI